jgi:hypothetical protein
MPVNPGQLLFAYLDSSVLFVPVGISDQYGNGPHTSAMEVQCILASRNCIVRDFFVKNDPFFRKFCIVGTPSPTLLTSDVVSSPQSELWVIARSTGGIRSRIVING